MTHTQASDLIEALLDAYKMKIKDTSAYGAYSGFLMGLSCNMLSDMNLGADYWIEQIQKRINELREDVS